MTLAVSPSPLPPVLAGMGREEALAFVSRMFDSAAAGDHLWSDAELVEGFLSNCSKTGSPETRSGYEREIRAFDQWRWNRAMEAGLREPPPLRMLSPQQAEAWVAYERADVESGYRKPRSFNRRVAAVSALYRWASEPNRSGFTGVPRNPLPRRCLMDAPKQPKPLSESDWGRVIGAIDAAIERGDRMALRDRAIVVGSYRLGCRVSELIGLRWGDIQIDDKGATIRVLGKGSKPRSIRVSLDTAGLFTAIRPASIGEEDWVFPAPRKPGEHLTRQAIGSRVRQWGKAALGADARVWPHRLRATHASHAVARKVDTFLLSSTLGHSSVATTAHYVAHSPHDSSSLRLG